MRDKFLPIVIGAYDEADKMTIAGRPKRIFKHGRDVFIVRLKKRSKRGTPLDDFDIERDVASVCCHLHFCKKEALRIFISVLLKTYEDWSDDE